MSLDESSLEARELLGVAELEGGDSEVGREVSSGKEPCCNQTDSQHLLHLFPPYTPEPPSSPSPYLYLAQIANDPQEALGYYSTAASMLENVLASMTKVSSTEEGEEERKMAVTALVAMIEIWMSDLWYVPSFFLYGKNQWQLRGGC